MALRGGGGNEEVCNRLTGNFSLGTSSTLSILPVDLTKCSLQLVLTLSTVSSFFLFYESTLSKPSYF